MGIWIGLADIVMIMGRWSLLVCGPCCIWKLKVNFLLVMTLSGVVRLLLPVKVGKKGPW